MVQIKFYWRSAQGSYTAYTSCIDHFSKMKIQSLSINFLSTSCIFHQFKAQYNTFTIIYKLRYSSVSNNWLTVTRKLEIWPYDTDAHDNMKRTQKWLLTIKCNLSLYIRGINIIQVSKVTNVDMYLKKIKWFNNFYLLEWHVTQTSGFRQYLDKQTRASLHASSNKVVKKYVKKM